MTEQLKQEFKEKEISAAQAASMVKSGMNVYIGCCTSYARAIADELAKRSEELEDQRAYMQTVRYIEEIARKVLGLVYPDETILRPEEEE